jgi:glycosyltransferase involved in cell wall biosynthesis
MRIAVWHNLNSGGGKRALFDHVKGLVERGHTVVSFRPDTADPDYLPLSSLTEERVYPLKDKINKSLKGFKYFNSPGSLYEKFKAEIEHCKECAKDINEGNFDVLLANSSSVISMSHIGRYVNIPKTIYLGEPHRMFYEAKREFLWRAPIMGGANFLGRLAKVLKQQYKMFWYSLLVKEEYVSARAFDTILVNSYFSRESIKRSYFLDSKVCYLGIDTNKFAHLQSDKSAYVLGLGAIIDNKGIEQCIDAISLIEEPVRPVLLWIGNRKKSDYAQQLENYAHSKKVTLDFKTNVSDKELSEFLSRACVFLYFSHLEPFGLAPLEANASGTAVIGIHEGGIRETIVDNVNGFTVKHFDPAEIAKYIKLFVSDLNYAKEFGIKSSSYIKEKWNLEQGIDNIENSLKYVIANYSSKYE